jgi:hypothetical protein
VGITIYLSPLYAREEKYVISPNNVGDKTITKGSMTVGQQQANINTSTVVVLVYFSG